MGALYVRSWALPKKISPATTNACTLYEHSGQKVIYSQCEIDYLFKTLVISTITFGLSVYGSSPAELNTLQRFFDRCFKRKYMSEPVNIRHLLEIQGRNIFKASVNQKSAIADLIPRKKSTSYSLRTEFSQYSRVNTERFKLSFANRLIFNYNLFI